MTDMILAIETSTREASLVLLAEESDELVWQAGFESDRLHNAKIFDPIAEALEICRGKLQRIVVGLGPGTYSGIRVGISVANGLGLALDVPVAGMASIAVLSDEAEFVVTGDARRSSYYLASIRDHRLQGEPDLLDKADWKSQLASLHAKGIPVYTTEQTLADQQDISNTYSGNCINVRQPTAMGLARQTAAMESTETAEWSRRSEQALQPIYLRAPYITQPKKK